MSSNPVQVFIAAYQTEDGAGAALKDFRAMHREGSIELIDAAVAVHTADGKVKIEETADPSGKTWGKRGAIAGGIVGLIFPPSIIAGALVGGAGVVHRGVQLSGVTANANTVYLGRDHGGDVVGVPGRLGRVAVVGAFDGVVAHLAFDDSGVGAADHPLGMMSRAGADACIGV